MWTARGAFLRVRKAIRFGSVDLRKGGVQMRYGFSARRVLIAFAVATVASDLSQNARGDHAWNPEPTKASLMVISAHPDDEGLFFGGTIPYYSNIAQMPMVHISMTSGEQGANPYHVADLGAERESELGDADWTYGLRNKPLFARFADFYDMGPNSDNETFAVWNGATVDSTHPAQPADIAAGRLKAAQYLADQIRLYRPEVILTQDLQGEYGAQYYNGFFGNGNHMATAEATADAFALAANPSYSDGLTPWQADKLYTHLYNHDTAAPMLSKLLMDWSTPYAALGSQTPLQVANEGLAMHASQGGADLVTEWDGKRFSEQWGLYLSTVGPDTVGSDGWANGSQAGGFFENVTVVPEAGTEVALLSGLFALLIVRGRARRQ
jgi:LmbE family N-acetylglucosaminyl deacetylase